MCLRGQLSGGARGLLLLDFLLVLCRVLVSKCDRFEVVSGQKSYYPGSTYRRISTIERATGVLRVKHTQRVKACECEVSDLR